MIQIYANASFKHLTDLFYSNLPNTQQLSECKWWCELYCVLCRWNWPVTAYLSTSILLITMRWTPYSAHTNLYILTSCKVHTRRAHRTNRHTTHTQLTLITHTHYTQLTQWSHNITSQLTKRQNKSTSVFHKKASVMCCVFQSVKSSARFFWGWNVFWQRGTQVLRVAVIRWELKKAYIPWNTRALLLWIQTDKSEPLFHHLCMYLSFY